MTGQIDGEILSTHNFLIDAFGVPVTNGVRNKIDLPSTYDFNTERYRLFVNGTRTDPGEPAFTDHFTDQPSTYDLEADAGDTVRLEVRERPRYVPGFEILYGIAHYMGSALPSGGVIRVGLRDVGENEFRVEYRPDSAEVEIVKGGTETVSQDITEGVMPNRDITFAEKLQQPQIDRHKANMYGVGNFKPGASYLNPVDTGDLDLGIDEANVQQNENMLAEHIRANDVSVQDDVGVGNLSDVNTEEFNMHLSIELDLDGASSAATLRVLSQQYIVLGDVAPTTRPKPATFFDVGGGIGAGWNDAEILFRTDPNQENVDVDLRNLSVTPTDDMAVYAFGFEPDDIADANTQDLATIQGNFTEVQEQQGYEGGNTVLQANAVNAPYSYPTKSITDPFGNTVTVPDDGRLLTRGAESGGSSQGGGTPPPGETSETKRTIFNDDFIALIPRGSPGISSASISILSINTEQDW